MPAEQAIIQWNVAMCRTYRPTWRICPATLRNKLKPIPRNPVLWINSYRLYDSNSNTKHWKPLWRNEHFRWTIKESQLDTTTGPYTWATYRSFSVRDDDVDAIPQEPIFLFVLGPENFASFWWFWLLPFHSFRDQFLQQLAQMIPTKNNGENGWVSYPHASGTRPICFPCTRYRPLNISSSFVNGYSSSDFFPNNFFLRWIMLSCGALHFLR